MRSTLAQRHLLEKLPAIARQGRVPAHLLAAGAIAVICFWVYAPALHGGFVWDDHSLFIQNAHRWTWSNIGELLSRQDNLFAGHHTGFFRPLPNLSFLIDRYLWGFRPAGFHLTNIVLHTLSALVLFRIALKLFGDWPAAVAAAVFFALHPANVESVAWINGRNNVMAGLFYLWAFLAHLKWRSSGRAVFAGIACLALAGSILSKEYALSFPLVVMLHELSCSDRPGRKPAMGAMANRLLPYAVVLIGYLALRHWAISDSPALDLAFAELPVRLLTLPHLSWRYLELLICPLNLTPLHAVAPLLTPSDPRFLPQVAVVAFLLGLWGWSLGRRPLVFFGAGWTMANLIIVLGIVPIPHVQSMISEHYLYLPTAGMAMAAVAGMESFRRRGGAGMRAVVVALALTVAGLAGHLAGARTQHWASEINLWEDAVAQNPDHVKAWVNLAIASAQAGQLARARQQIGRAIGMEPSDMAYFILGVVMAAQGDAPGAKAALAQALALNPGHPDAKRLMADLENR